MRSIIAIESQAPNIMIAGKTNLLPSLPKPFIELAIQIAKGSADFLRKDLVEALKDLKDEQLSAQFRQSNRKAASALQDYADWLTKEKLPNATRRFRARRRKVSTHAREDPSWSICRRRKFSRLGLQKLKEEQDIFAEAAKIIDPQKPPIEVFKQIQKEHPKADALIADVAKDLDKIRKYLVDHKIVAIPSDVRAKVAETPQFARATSFASMDTPGPFEKKATEAYYYVTPPENRLAGQAERTNGSLHLTITPSTSSRSTKPIPGIMCSFCT